MKPEHHPRPDAAARAAVRRAAAWHAAILAGVVAAGALAAAPARAQGGLDAQSVRQFGGSYAIDCADPAAPRLRVTGRALTVEQNGQRMTARNVNAVASFFEPQTPPDFRVALIGETRGATQLLFLTYADASGLYVMLDGDLKVQEALGGRLLRAKFRRCDPNGASAAAALNPPAAGPNPPGTAAPAALAGATPPAPAVPDVSALLADPAFKRAYLRSVGPKTSERWLARFDGPAPPTRELVIDGSAYIVVSVCKAHDCYDNNAVFLYSAEQDRVLGMIQQGGVKTLVGAPTPAMGAQLDRLWATEWRQAQK